MTTDKVVKREEPLKIGEVVKKAVQEVNTNTDEQTNVTKAQLKQIRNYFNNKFETVNEKLDLIINSLTP